MKRPPATSQFYLSFLENEWGTKKKKGADISNVLELVNHWKDNLSTLISWNRYCLTLLFCSRLVMTFF